MNLFDRLPNALFGPLTGRYNRRAWELLVRLSERFFGADCVPPYAEGYLHEQVTKEIERFLLDEQWEEESPDAAVMLPPYSSPRPSRNKPPGPLMAPAALVRPAAS